MFMSRQLATIQIIKELLPIEGANKIELATFESIGWKCVVKKGEFKVRDKAVYFEIDSLLPLVPTFEFLAKGSKAKTTILEDGTAIAGWRLKSVKMRGQLSQGLALPLSILPSFYKSEDSFGIPMIIKTDWSESEDVSEYIGVCKYEAPIPSNLAEIIKGYFPIFIPKTDAIRIQNCSKMIQEYADNDWVSTLKYEGSSCTIYKKEGIFGVCGRTLDFIEDEGNTFWQVANRYNLKEKLPEGFAIQGEVYGEKLQGNPHNIKGQDIAAFNVFDITNQKFLNFSEMCNFLNGIGVPVVQFWSHGSLSGVTLDKLLEMADNTKLEGLVFKPTNEIIDLRFGRVFFKVISNNYLLNEK